MRRFIYTFMLLLVAKSFAFSQCNQKLVDFCAQKVMTDAKYIREYRARLAESDAEKPSVARFSVLLTKGSTYRFNVCSALDFEGEAVLQLFDGDEIVASTFHQNSKTNFRAFEMQCNKTAIYNIYISFIEGKQGCAVGVLSLVNK